MTKDKLEQLRRQINDPGYMDRAVNVLADNIVNGLVELRVTKYCKRCNTYKEEDAFANNCKAKDGKNYYCRPCQSELMRIYQERKRGKL